MWVYLFEFIFNYFNFSCHVFHVLFIIAYTRTPLESKLDELPGPDWEKNDPTGVQGLPQSYSRADDGTWLPLTHDAGDGRVTRGVGESAAQHVGEIAEQSVTSTRLKDNGEHTVKVKGGRDVVTGVKDGSSSRHVGFAADRDTKEQSHGAGRVKVNDKPAVCVDSGSDSTDRESDSDGLDSDDFVESDEVLTGSGSDVGEECSGKGQLITFSHSSPAEQVWPGVSHLYVESSTVKGYDFY